MVNHALANRLGPRPRLLITHQRHRRDLSGPMAFGAVLVEDRRNVFGECDCGRGQIRRLVGGHIQKRNERQAGNHGAASAEPFSHIPPPVFEVHRYSTDPLLLNRGCVRGVNAITANNKTTGVITYRSVSKGEYKPEDDEKTTPTCGLRAVKLGKTATRLHSTPSLPSVKFTAQSYSSHFNSPFRRNASWHPHASLPARLFWSRSSRRFWSGIRPVTRKTAPHQPLHRLINCGFVK